MPASEEVVRVVALHALGAEERVRYVADLAAAHAAQFGGRSEAVRAEAYGGEARDPAVLPTTFVAVEGTGADSAAVGSVAVVPDDMDGRRPGLTPWIATLWVAPASRRRGIATRLLQTAVLLAGAAAAGGKVYLWTHTPALEAKLYGPAGFEVVERMEHRGGVAAVMAAAVPE